jgi:hypothetical protein
MIADKIITQMWGGVMAKRLRLWCALLLVAASAAVSVSCMGFKPIQRGSTGIEVGATETPAQEDADE